MLELTSKIRVSADEALSEAFPGIQAAVVTVAAKNGTFTERVDYPKGEPENPLKPENPPPAAKSRAPKN